jgi:hypothetical protein
MNTENMNEREREEKGSRGPSGSITGALILILLGVIFLVRQVSGFRFENWWALFILIPAFSGFGTALALWRRNGRFTFGVWSSFYGGLFPLLVAVMFLFSLDWGTYWPLFVILPGVGMTISGLPFRRSGDHKVPAALLCHRSWALGIGISAILVGFTFLSRYLGWGVDLRYLNVENWWGIFILIPAFGGLVTMFCLLFGGHSILLVLINLGAAGLVAFAGVVAMLGLDWNLVNMVAPLILILAGLGLIVGFGGKKESSSNNNN